jgi:hypothetical protein
MRRWWLPAAGSAIPTARGRYFWPVLATLALTVALVDAPAAPLLALVLVIFGYGQGLVMAPLSGTVLSTVKPAGAGSGAGMYGTTSQIANATGVAAIGATFFATEAVFSARLALFASLTLFALSIAMCAAFLSWMRRATPNTSSQNLTPINDDDHNPGD